MPRPFWTLDADIAEVAWGRTTPLELNNGYPHTFTQVIKVPATMETGSFANGTYMVSQDDTNATPYISGSIATETTKAHRIITSSLQIGEPTVPADTVKNIRSTLQMWIAASKGGVDSQFKTKN